MAKKKNRLVLKRETAVKVFEGLGFKTAGKWNNERLRKKVSNLPELVDGVKSKDKWMKKALTAIRGADVVVLAKTEDEQQKKEKEQKEEKVLQKEAKKKSVSLKKEKEKKTKKSTKGTKRKKRIDYICDTLKNIPKGGQSLEDSARKANQACAEDGNNSNESQTQRYLQVVLPVLINFGLFVKKDGKLYPSK